MIVNVAESLMVIRELWIDINVFLTITQPCPSTETVVPAVKLTEPAEEPSYTSQGLEVLYFSKPDVYTAGP